MISIETQGTLICGGDFNIILNSKMDTSTLTEKPITSTAKKFKGLLGDVGLIDLWRDFFPKGRDYTHYLHAHSKYSRIDYLFLFRKDRHKINKCTIGTMDLSDHAPVYASVSLNKIHINTLWRLNSSILNNEQFIENWMKTEIKHYLEENDNGGVSPAVLWDACKAVLRGKKNYSRNSIS